MGKKSRRSRQKQPQPESFRPDAEVMRLVEEIFRGTTQPPGEDEWEDFVAIRKLVDQLIDKQSACRASADGHEAVCEDGSRADRFPAFREWLVANGVDVHCVDFIEFPGVGFGVKALTHIKEHEQFLMIPQKLMITAVTASESRLKFFTESDHLLQTMPNVALAVHLVCEQFNPDSFWRPYIDVLPETFATPLYYNVEEIKLLEGSTAYMEAINQSKSIARQYAYLLKLFLKHPEAKHLSVFQRPFTYEDYRWATSCVMTRQNRIPIKDGEDSTLALIPGWDMCNHCEGAITTDFSLAQHCCLCYAMKDFPVGSEVVMCYGPRTNAEFVVNSGFFYDKNPIGRLKIRLGVSKNDHLFGLKTQLLSHLNIPESASFCIVDEQYPITLNLLAFLRVFCMTNDQLLERVQADLSKISSLRSPVSKVSYENEKGVFTFLETRSSLLLRRYKSTVEEDEALLRKGDLTVFATNAVKLRKQEKEILIRTLQFAKSQLEVLNIVLK